jgi:plastocyanin
MRRLAGITGVCAALLAGTAAIALGAPATITNNPADNTFLPTSFNHDAGTVATYLHSGGAPHDVTATTNGPDGKALFRSATISSGSTPVNGTQFLGPGPYPFFCTVHGPSMSGTLIVGAGTPQARPSVALQVLDKKLAEVVKKKQLRVQVTTTGSGKAPVSAFLGKKEVATAGEVTAPGTKVLKLKLTAKGRNAIKKKAKVTLTVKSSIAFGKPATATAKLK